jgi:predicted ATP-grasp superfamily ATP-dependent carboligase
VLATAGELGVQRIVTLGALLADVPHTRPVPVTMSTSDGSLAKSMGLEASRYQGPTGIVGVLQDAATRGGLAATTLWAAVPHYVAQSPCPKATLVLLRRVEDLLNVPVPLGDLPDEARAWQHGVEELATEDPEIADYVRRLEQARDTTDLPEASGEHIAREFERYLRRRDE